MVAQKRKACELTRDPPHPQDLLTAAIVEHELDGAGMLALAAKGPEGAEELAGLCDGFADFPPDYRVLFVSLCQALLRKF